MEYDFTYLLFSTLVALIDHISPPIRAITLDFDNNQKQFILRYFYHGEMTDHLSDLISCTAAEIDSEDIKIEQIRLDYPEKIPIQGRLIYLRKEMTPTIYEQKNGVLFADQSSPLDAVVLLAMQDALLGKVTPELRQVSIGTDKTKQQLDFYFFYDGEISKENLDLANLAIQEAGRSFSGYLIKKHISRVDFPKKLPLVGERVSYARCEDYC